MKSADKVISSLWEEYMDLIKKDIPVYFTFTRDIVDYLLHKNDIEFNDPIECINNLAKEYLYIDSDTVYVLEKTYNPNSEGHSAVILLVCQQILVVEEMVRCESYTENAYFPRLRAAISKDLDQISLNPFIYDEFENIWRQFSKEIYQINQSSKSVTFEFGEVKGAAKAKRFPLSQALFTKEDIVRLVESIGHNRIKSKGTEEVFSLIRANKRILNKRGRYLITLPWLKESLVRQVRSLGESVSEFAKLKEKINSEKKDVSSFYLKVYLDNKDWFDVEYVLNIFDSNDEPVFDLGHVKQYLKKLKDSNDYSILSPSQMGESWTLKAGDYQPVPGDYIFIVFEKEKDMVQSIMTGYLGAKENELQWGEFSRVDKLCFCRYKIQENIDEAVVVRNGRISKVQDVVKKIPVSFYGGIAVNKSQDRFSSFYLPHSVKIGSEIHKLEGKVRVNDRISSFEMFRDEVVTITTNEDYSFELENGVEFKLKVAPRFKSRNHYIEFEKFRGDLNPISRLVNQITYSNLVNSKTLMQTSIELKGLKKQGLVDELAREIARLQGDDQVQTE